MREVALAVTVLMLVLAVQAHGEQASLVVTSLVASTYYGGSGGDSNNEVPCAIDAEGNVYIANRTNSADLPTTPGAYDSALGGTFDVFVAKFDPDLTTLLAATYLGGSGAEGAFPGVNLVLDEDGDVWVSGVTKSADFPRTPGSYDSTYGGGGDIFITELSPDLGSVLTSTYLGGSGADERPHLVIQDGDVYIVGITGSADFPTTPGCYDAVYDGLVYDTFVARLDDGLTTLIGSTLVGGTGRDVAEAIGLGADGGIYITGWAAAGYPTTPGAYCETYRGGGYDVFVSEFSPDLATLEASTFVGGVQWDVGYDLVLDAAGDIYVSGHTGSVNFPHTAGVFDSTYNNLPADPNGHDAFVFKISGDLSDLLASTFLGGNHGEIACALALKGAECIYVAGETNSTDFPVGPAAFDTTYGGSTNEFAGDMFVARFDCALATLEASTYVGGNSIDNLDGIALDQAGNVLIAGSTSSADYPVTGAAYDTTYNGGASIGEGYDWGGDIAISILDPWLSGAASSVAEWRSGEEFGLRASPNPFAAATTIAYNLARASQVRLAIYSTTGRLVRVVQAGEMDAGRHQVTWDGIDSLGRHAAPGVYFARLTSEGATSTRPVVLVN